MGLESKSLKKGNMMTGRKKSYGMLLVLALGAALLSILVLHKLRERRVLGLLVQDQERDLLAFQVLWQKEREKSKELKSRLDDLRERTISLSQQKTELYDKLMETETTVVDLKRRQEEMEAALSAKENEINQINQKTAESVELLKQKEAEMEQMKKQLPEVHQSEQFARKETWVKLETIIGDEGRKDESGSDDNQSAAAEASEDKGQESPVEAEQHREKLKDEELDAGAGDDKPEELVSTSTSTSREMEEKERSDSKNEVRKDESGSDGNQNSSEDNSQESTVEPEEHGEKLKDEELQVGAGDDKPDGSESNSREMEEKEQLATEDEDSKKLKNSQFILEEQTGPDGMDSTIEQPKIKHRRGKKAKTKSKKRRMIPKGMESEKHDGEQNRNLQEDENQLAKTEPVDADSKEELTAGGQPEVIDQLTTDKGSSNDADKEQIIHLNDQSFDARTSPHENKASETTEPEENSNHNDTERGTHNADDNADGSFSSTSEPDAPEKNGATREVRYESSTGGEHEAEEKEVLLTDRKLVDSENAHDDLNKPNNNDLQNNRQEETSSAM